GFIYDIRTAILPFMFIFNTQLLLIGLTGPLDLIVTIVSALAAMLIFAAATQGYWLTRTRWYETVALLLVTFTLFRPGFWWDDFYPPHKMVPATGIEEIASQKPAGAQLPIHVTGTTIEGDEVDKTVLIPLGPKVEGARRLSNAGLTLSKDGDTVKVDSVAYGSAASKAGVDFGFHITAVQVDVPRPPKELMFIPALALLGLVGWLQVRRRRRQRQHGEPLPQGA
ncbi:MAG TPA: DUF3394 domain-containing protein, partial [Gammaproteobacteria bacterium]|nr:DUF3394 domain-containing protein [Gammaproteobacteria bacterium]